MLSFAERVHIRLERDRLLRDRLHTVELECLNCGVPLSGQRTKYCGDKCRQAYWLQCTDRGREWQLANGRKRRAEQKAAA